jgi:mannosyltransferase
VAQIAPPREAAAARPAPAAAAAEPVDLDERGLHTAVWAVVAAVAAFLAARLTAWPPHEDEALALYVGQGSLGGLVDTVLGERGGAPLHFVFAWIVAQLGGGLTGLRVVSALFALASLPLVAALAARLADRRTAAVAVALAASSWVLLFHAVYARMYSLFLFASALSYLALLWALRRGGAWRWAAWGVAVLMTVATHPYGALVLASQGLYVLLVRERLREAVAAFGVVLVLGTPFWITDLVLAGRFDVGVGPGGARLGRPDRVIAYLGDVGADFSAGPVLLPVALVLAALGAVRLWRERRATVLLALAVVATPTLAFVVARLGASAAPETRHLIFALPFFAALVAHGVLRFARPIAVAAAVILVGGGVGWAWQKTPALFLGEPDEQSAARAAASDWLAQTGRPDDVLLGYEPVFLGAWQRDGGFSRLVLPRADAKLAAETLRDAPKPLGRGVWILNAYDTTNPEQNLDIPLRIPRPLSAFEARAFGSYLVLRTREPVRTPQRYLELAAAAMVIGKTLDLGDPDVNFATISRAADRLGR